jgi:hypothetical protein
MELVLSFMGIGAFCLVALIIETLIGGEPQSGSRLRDSKRRNRNH